MRSRRVRAAGPFTRSKPVLKKFVRWWRCRIGGYCAEYVVVFEAGGGIFKCKECGRIRIYPSEPNVWSELGCEVAFEQKLSSKS
jgi:hypothetical protein